MNDREIYKNNLPVIQAYAEGKAIQVRAESDCEWVDFEYSDPAFGSKHWEWRVKPVPATKEVCIFWYDDGGVHMINDPELFNSICRQGLLATRRVVITEGEGM